MALGVDAWEFWWQHNEDALILAEPQPTPSETSTSHLTGKGRRQRGTGAARKTAHHEIVPVLQAILRTESERDLCDSAVLALGRVAPAALAPFVRGDLERALAHPDLSVQTSATLALGVLGSRELAPLLRDLVRDAPEGRRAIGGGSVPWQIRAYAALALGLVDDPGSVELLADIVRQEPNSARELRTAAVVGLGLMSNPRAASASDSLLELMDGHGGDEVVEAHAATSLAKLGDPTSLPRLLKRFRNPETPDLVRQSIAIALGRLATPRQEEVVDALIDSVENDNDGPTRHFALVALARLAGHPAASKAVDSVERIGDALREQVRDPRRRIDRPWAALAAGLYAREHAPAFAEVILARYPKERDPSSRAAFVLALGIAGSVEAAPAILEDLLDSKDDAFRGYAAIALGLLQHDPAIPTLLALASDESRTHTMRQQVVKAIGLLHDPTLTDALLEQLDQTGSIDHAWSVGRALGQLRDPKSIAPLLSLIEDESRAVVTRAFACVTLGLVGDKDAVRFNAPIGEDLNYLAGVSVLSEVLGL